MGVPERNKRNRKEQNMSHATDIEPTQLETNATEVVDNFENMGLAENLLRGVYAYGFEKPSAIQQRAIIPLSKGHDLIAQAQSGTGKTATFSIGALQRQNPENKVFKLLLVLLVVFKILLLVDIFAQKESKHLFLMKLMKCFLVDLKIKFMIFSLLSTKTFKFAYSLLPCHLRH